MTQDNLAARDDDTVTISRAEHERLLWLTTPKPINTVPIDKEVLMLESFFGDDERYWIQGSKSMKFGFEGLTPDDDIKEPSHWLPLPETKQS